MANNKTTKNIINNHDTQYFSATSTEVGEAMLKMMIDKAKKKKDMMRPLIIGFSILAISVLAYLIVYFLPDSHVCKRSDDCGNVYLMTFMMIFDTPIILYGISLTFTSLFHFCINKFGKKPYYRNTHPFLWSLLVFAVFGLLTFIYFRYLRG